MSLHDRHYARDIEPRPGTYGRGGWQSLRMVSANVWIIVACVAVFLIDGFLPIRSIPTENFFPPELAKIDRSLLALGRIQVVPITEARPDGRDVKRDAYLQVVLDKRTGIEQGWVEVRRMPYLQTYLHFSTKLFLWPHLEFWRVLGFQFLHAGIAHLVFNMLGLYFFGSLVEEYLGSKRYLAFYLLCGIFGALMYMLLNLGGYVVGHVLGWSVRIPGFLFDDPGTPLVGASAGVFGVIMAGAFIAPRERLYLLHVIPLMQIQTFAYMLVATAFLIVFFGGNNAGGEAGHLGGAIAGWYLIRHPYHLHNFFDILGRVDPTSHHYRGKSPGRVPGASRARDEEVDRILAKIHEQGRDALTESERRTLRDASSG